ncbi:cupin domain-containing protein [Nonomuraea insulae]|uniref:Cupin domain-containing protein n=1 Tax=Nonomuraea insulae TaxID=1616787 RepID=A0ABW1D8X5_9ACTN
MADNPMAVNIDSRLGRSADHVIVPMPWGRLEWRVSAEIGNSATMTVGTCFIDVGMANGRHFHPNCDEVLTVVRGQIVHSWNGEERVMNVGDVISIPQGVVHNARNTGDTVAELAICFSSAYRTTCDEPAQGSLATSANSPNGEDHDGQADL